MRLARASIEAELDRIEAEAQRATEALAERVRVEIVAPLCELTGYDFISGNGSFSFHGPGGINDIFWDELDCPEEMTGVLRLLSSGTFDRFNLGHFVGDVHLDPNGKAI